MPGLIAYSNTAGNTPSSLGNGDIGINQADGKLFYRDANGVVTQFSAGGGGSSSVVEADTPAGFPATGSANTLYLARDSRRLYSWTGSVYAEVGAVSSYDSRWDLFLPPAPTGVTGTSGNAQVALSWTAPTVSSQTPVLSYTVQYSSNGGTTWTTFGTQPTTNSVLVTGLTNSVAYTFRVSATNAVGTGSYSSASGSITAGADAFFSSVQVLLHMEGSGATFTDSSGTPKTITAAGSVTQSTAQFKYGTKSALFSTSSDSLSFADVALGTGDFCVECFFRISSSSQYAQIFGNESSGSGSGFSLLINNDSSTGGQIALYRAGGLVVSSTGGTDWSDGAWHHVALARSGSTIRLYLDGTSVASATDSNSYTGSTWYLGLNGQYAGRSISSGYIDEFRLTKGTARGYTTASITVPTSAFPDA